MSDFLLASGHHLAAFLLFGALFAEFIVLRPGGSSDPRRLRTLDAIYGLSALAVLVFGVLRLIFAAKGWEFYQNNAYFWTKMALFLSVGLLSIPPTLAFRNWRKLAAPPTDSQVARVRRYLHVQLLLFAFIPIAAAAMARGYGPF